MVFSGGKSRIPDKITTLTPLMSMWLAMLRYLWRLHPNIPKLESQCPNERMDRATKARTNPLACWNPAGWCW